MYERYDDKLDDILNYITNQTDLDDLYECVIKGERSEKYEKLQQLLNGMVDDFELFYLYSVFIRDKLMVNICSATSNEERAKGETDMPLLDTSDAYPEEELKKFSDAIAKDDISYFEENSEWATPTPPVSHSRILLVSISAFSAQTFLLMNSTRPFTITFYTT